MITPLVYCFAEAFVITGNLADISYLMQTYWAWAFLFSILSDFILIDGIFMALVTAIVLKLGSTPDACGRNRDFWLKLIPPAIKDSLE
jgi:hypothetical protein